jgi:hypothetical protein
MIKLRFSGFYFFCYYLVMKLVETDALVTDLEYGLGEVDEHTRAFPASLRLRTGVCALTSIAIADHLLERGVLAHVIVSRPNLDIGPELQHAMVLAHHEGQTGVIDPTYTQFLKYAGLDPSYVVHGGLDAYPTDKIASFNANEDHKVVTQLSLITEYFMKRYKPIANFPYTSGRSMRFEGMNDEQVEARLSEIWNPANWRHFEPSERTLDAGKNLSRFILPGHVKLVA